MKCIPNNTDFKFLVSFKDSDGVLLNYEDFEWELQYYTTPHIQLKATHTINNEGQHVYSTNVKIVDQQNLQIIVNNFDFVNKGVVKCKAILHFINADFPDGVQTVPSMEKSLDISIV